MQREAAPQTRQSEPERREERSPREAEGVAEGGLAAAAVLRLQRELGNRRVQRMLAFSREGESPAGEISPEVEQAIARSRGGGRPLDGEVRGRMEASFGADFGGVRVHTGAEPDRLNRQLSARAFTTGSDIFFREGEYRPGSSAGRELLAHELTHVVQQQGTVQTSRLTLGPPGDRFEQEADAAARRVVKGEEVQVAPGASEVARSLQRDEDEGLEDDPYAESMNPLVVPAATFDQAARTFSDALLQVHPTDAGAGVVVINGANVRLYSGYGEPAASTAFRLKRPAGLGPGVYAQLGGDLRLHKVYIHPDGKWVPSPATVTGDIDFRRDVEPRQPFDNAFQGFKGAVFYIVPGVRPELVPEEDLPKAPPQEDKPEFMKVDTHGRAELPPYLSAVVPLTPQVTAVGTTGKFYCRLDKILWTSTLDNVAALLEGVNFKWEVLKLDPQLLVTEKDTATRWEATKERFRTRARHIRDDEKTLRGDERASVPEKVFRGYLEDQVAVPRRILAYSGEAVLTLMHSLVGGKDPNVEDYIDYTFKEPGDYFVRCLATPVMGSKAKRRRATSVAGVMVSVFDVKDVAAEAVDTSEEILGRAVEGLEQFEERLAKLHKDREAADTPEKRAEADLRIGMFTPRRAYLEAVQRAGGDAHGALAAELELVRAQLAFANGKDAPAFRYRANRAGLRQLVEKLKQDEKRLAGQLERSESKLGENVKRTGFLRAVLVDDVTGARQEVLLSIGERQYVAAGRLEVVIADVTSPKGRRFNGMGSGLRARSDAWTGAMRDLQRNLGRGRGWLSYQAPPPYSSLMQGLANPMQLQVAELDQLKDIADDAMNALTLGALLAAPFTGGASLGLLAVLVPIQIGSSLYNIVNRAMYDDLELDADAIFSLLDIASFGVAKIGTMGRAAKRSVSLMATGSRIALQLLDGGGYVVLSYTTYAEIMRDDPGETPEQARVRKLRALLQLFQGASIPVAGRLFHQAGMNPDGSLLDEAPAPRDKPAPEPVPADRAPAKPAPGPEGAPAVPREYLAELKDVAKRVPPVINPALETGTVRIRYRQKDGVITEMWMEIAPGTPAARVRQHVPTARDMARYMGLSGRVRKIYQQIVDWLSRNPSAGPESRAWEARREVEKLQRMIDEQFEAYDKAVAEDNTALRDELSRELDHLEAQLLAHARDVDRFDVAGRGFVAAEGAGGTFGPETSRSEAFRELGGFETRVEGGRLEAGSDLRRFVDAAVRERVAAGPDEFVRQMPDPRGLGRQSVLDLVKDPYLAKLVDRASDPKRLRNLASYHEARKGGETTKRALHEAATAEAQRIAALLPETDRAAFFRAWSAKPTAAPVPRVRPEAIEAEALVEPAPGPARPPVAPERLESLLAHPEFLERLRSGIEEADRPRASFTVFHHRSLSPEGLRDLAAAEPVLRGEVRIEPVFKPLEELLTPDREGFTDKDLQEAYTRYAEDRRKAGETPASAEAWVSLTRGGSRERLEKILGPDYPFGGGTGVERLLPLADFTRPAGYTEERVDADLAAVTAEPGKLWERLGRLQDEGVTGGEVGASLFNILKGNVAEILSRRIQDVELVKVRRQHPDARLYDDVRARLVRPDGSVSEPVLFTDNVIASRREGGLQLHGIFEVKAGAHGGQEATTQIFEWIEGHLQEGLQIHVGGEWFRYDPAGTEPGRVVGLARAERHLIAVKGAEHLGLESEFKTVREPVRHALPQSAAEVNFLTRTLIEKHIRQHSTPAAPAAP